MKKSRLIVLLIIVCVVIFTVYKFFFQEVTITHISKEDEFEYGNLYTKYYLLDHFNKWDEDTKEILNLHVKEQLRHLKRGNELSLVYITNNVNILNLILGNYDRYIEDGVDNLATDDIVAQSYVVKDSAGTIRHQSIEFKNR